MKRENRLMKNDIPRDKNRFGVQVIKLIPLLAKRITNKNRRNNPWLEFISKIFRHGCLTYVFFKIMKIFQGIITSNCVDMMVKLCLNHCTKCFKKSNSIAIRAH